MKKLHVHYEGWGEKWLLGTLADDGTRLLFEYSPEAIRQQLELSPRHLKLRQEAYGGFPEYLLRLPGFIADALPDGWGLLLMDRLFRQQRRETATLSPLDRLAFIGSRALGALTFEPATQVGLPREDIALLELAQEIRAVITGQEGEALRELAWLGGSPHGARPKVLVNYEVESKRISTGALKGSAPWLVKFPSQHEHKEVCAIEALYADVARQCGLDVPATRYFDIDKTLAAFGIARFDAKQGLRVPVHTLAGLLHANFRIPSAVDYTTFLRATRMLTKDEREVAKAFERAVFNVVLGNRDDHCKNFSYLLDANRHWRLAPCYDITFSEGPGGEHQMDICGHGKAITREHLMTLARQSGVDEAMAKKTLERQLDVSGKALSVADDMPIRRKTLKAIKTQIESNRLRLIK